MSYVDPRIVPETGRERALLAEVRRRGLSLHKIHHEGDAVRVTGAGVHVIASSLRGLYVDDLDPVVGDAEPLRRAAHLASSGARPRRA